MHGRILGRSDDMFIVRAVNIYPGQIDHVLSQVSELGSEFQVHLERRKDGRDYMILKLERRPRLGADQNEAIAQRVARDIRQHILVSPEIEILDHGSLPRTERKSTRVFDHRG
jgi:phenylacetate-CoA ligase